MSSSDPYSTGSSSARTADHEDWTRFCGQTSTTTDADSNEPPAQRSAIRHSIAEPTVHEGGAGGSPDPGAVPGSLVDRQATLEASSRVVRRFFSRSLGLLTELWGFIGRALGLQRGWLAVLFAGPDAVVPNGVETPM